MPSRCDRMRSREARKYAETRLLSIVRDSGAELSAACPLGTELDLLIEQERGKRRISARLWGCGLCHKQFRTEHHLDAHLDRRHGDRLPTEGSCPADYCDILRCESWASVLRKRLARGSGPACDESLLSSRRHYCTRLLHDCLPGWHDQEVRTLVRTLNASLCQPLTCAWRQRCYALDAEVSPDGHPPCDLVPPRSAGIPAWAAVLAIIVFFVIAGACICLLDEHSGAPPAGPEKDDGSGSGRRREMDATAVVAHGRLQAPMAGDARYRRTRSPPRGNV